MTGAETFRVAYDPLVDHYGMVLLFKSPEDARAAGAVKVFPLVTAKMPRKRKVKT